MPLTTEQLSRIWDAMADMEEAIRSEYAEDVHCGLADPDEPPCSIEGVGDLLDVISAAKRELEGKQPTTVYICTGTYMSIIIGTRAILTFRIELRHPDYARRATSRNKAVTGWTESPLSPRTRVFVCSLADLFAYLRGLGADVRPVAALAREQGWEDGIVEEALNGHAWLSHSPKSSQAAWTLDQATRALVDLKAIRIEGELPDPEWEDRIDEVLAAIKSFKKYGDGNSAEMVQ